MTHTKAQLKHMDEFASRYIDALKKEMLKQMADEKQNKEITDEIKLKLAQEPRVSRTKAS